MDGLDMTLTGLKCTAALGLIWIYLDVLLDEVLDTITKYPLISIACTR